MVFAFLLHSSDAKSFSKTDNLANKIFQANRKFYNGYNGYNFLNGKMSAKNGYVMIPVKPDTKQDIDTTCPKGLTYDEFIWNMLQAYKKTKQEAKRYGKSSKDNQDD